MNDNNLVTSGQMDVDEDNSTKALLDFTEVIQTFIQKIGIQGMLDILEPYYTIFKSEKLINPKKEKIAEYCDAFGKILTSTRSINALFRIIKVDGSESANGKVFILEVRSHRKQKVIAKIPLVRAADPLSYEYYVGLSLNQLRIHNIPICSLMYSRFVCGIELASEQSLCGKGDKVSHLVYEYIRSEDGKVQSLREYIEKGLKADPEVVQENVINMLVYLLVYLQKAQDMMNFTHYDMHLDNIMLIKSSVTEELEYHGMKRTINMRYIPKIIDYGRAYISGASAVRKNTYNDVEEGKKYLSFEAFQHASWRGKSYYLDPVSEQLIRKQIKGYSDNLSVMEYVGCKNKEELVKKFYLDNENVIKHDIKSYKFNHLSDMFRLTKTLCATVRNVGMLNEVKVWDYWQTLSEKVNESYPFYVPRYYNLPKLYKSLNGRLNNPIELAMSISEDSGTPMTKYQIGGGDNEEMSKRLGRIKRKSIFPKADDFVYVVNETPKVSVKKQQSGGNKKSEKKGIEKSNMDLSKRLNNIQYKNKYGINSDDFVHVVSEAPKASKL
jgi:hypothetical protein